MMKGSRFDQNHEQWKSEQLHIYFGLALLFGCGSFISFLLMVLVLVVLPLNIIEIIIMAVIVSTQGYTSYCYLQEWKKYL